MKVKDLIGKLSQLDPEALIVTESIDHSYRELRVAGQVKAEYNRKERYIGEYWDDQEVLDGSVIIPVVVIS